MTTTDPAERLWESLSSNGHPTAGTIMLDAALAAAYQRGRERLRLELDEAGTEWETAYVVDGKGAAVGRLAELLADARREGARDAVERIRARALEYFGDGITPREVDAILDAEADR